MNMKKLHNWRTILVVSMILTLLLPACSGSPESSKDNPGDTTVVL